MKFCPFFLCTISFLLSFSLIFFQIWKTTDCSCRTHRHQDASSSSFLISSLCNDYASSRGLHQHVISISMFGSHEYQSFLRPSFLHQLIGEMRKFYPQWILRVYHDGTVSRLRICEIECQYSIVDFCDMNALKLFGSIADFVPGKIWRFLSIADRTVDVMLSRDLDSPLTQREVDAVQQWLQSNKSWHVMRDHPNHVAAMMGGMWGFQSIKNRSFPDEILKKIVSRHRMRFYSGRGDQQFLRDHIWRYIADDVLVHDSFHCQSISFGHLTTNPQPWPTRRPLIGNDTGCFVGCVRPCCSDGKYPFEKCPLACRPRSHSDWTFC